MIHLAHLKFQVLAILKWSKEALFTTMTPIITPHTIVVHNMASNSLKISEILQTLKMTDTETDILNTRKSTPDVPLSPSFVHFSRNGFVPWHLALLLKDTAKKNFGWKQFSKRLRSWYCKNLPSIKGELCRSAHVMYFQLIFMYHKRMLIVYYCRKPILSNWWPLELRTNCSPN